MKSFAVVLAAVAAAAQGQVLHAGLPLAGLPAAGYAGLPAGYAAGIPAGIPAGYAGLPLAGHAGLPLAATYAAGPAVLPAAAPAVIAAAPKTYAVPPARIVQEPAVVETITTPVEQHGYKIKY